MAKNFSNLLRCSDLIGAIDILISRVKDPRIHFSGQLQYLLGCILYNFDPDLTVLVSVHPHISTGLDNFAKAQEALSFAVPELF